MTNILLSILAGTIIAKTLFDLTEDAAENSIINELKIALFAIVISSGFIYFISSFLADTFQVY